MNKLRCSTLPCVTVCMTVGLLACLAQPVQAQRTTVSLDGSWQIADSRAADAIPSTFDHVVPVPGLANLAQPPFKEADRFYSREHLARRIKAGLSPPEWLKQYWNGKVEQDRNFFWYRRTFTAPQRRAVALLKVNKAQFGTAVWLNGRKVGEYSGCFTAGYFDLGQAIQWGKENTLLIRIGAHPAVLPDTYPTGSDFEKIKWTPGIYDSVSLICCNNPLIKTIQVAPRIERDEIVVQTLLKNCGSAALETTLVHRVKSWKGQQQLVETPPQSVSLQPGDEQQLTQTIPIPNAHLWSPEDPFLYVLDTSTTGDSVSTRFGMREFHFDPVTKRAYLNGKVYYLRGSNITLHRFFEDPKCAALPWNERWVRRLLGDLPKQMHWNYFRFCIGPVPDRWLEICDEAGLLIQNEFFVWTGGPGWFKDYHRTYDVDEMIRQYKDWMRDDWNHPSVVVWDANNETKNEIFGKQIIPAVRSLDLSHRPWENSYNQPVSPVDLVEDHPYLMSGGYRGKLTFKMSDLETMDGKGRGGRLPSETNAPIINEYGWLWLNRDGTPTLLTENVYAQLMGKAATPRQRLDMWAYLLAGKTEFWRAHRQYAGVIHFVYLTCSYPGVYTSDHFRDVTHLQLDPAFADYVGEAFKPLGVYINFFHPTLVGGTKHSFRIMLVNDHYQPVRGTLSLLLERDPGDVVARVEQPFELRAVGDASYEMQLTIPQITGKCTLKAVAATAGEGHIAPTISRRWVSVTAD